MSINLLYNYYMALSNILSIININNIIIHINVSMAYYYSIMLAYVILYN